MSELPAWGHIPEELRALPQWLIAAPDGTGKVKAPHRLNDKGRLVLASNTDPSEWMDFNSAAAYAFEHNLPIGFVLTGNDPYAVIDLDVKDDTTQEQLNRYWMIAQAFDTYVELSQGGRGLHVWVYGKVENGARHDGVEVYGHSRFMICTGKHVISKPIAPRQELLDRLVGEIRAHQGATRKSQVELDGVEETETDDQILERARSADNSFKFIELYSGRWQQFGYPSQSEADLALMSMFTFYSRADEQCRRLFRGSALGKRDKAQKDDRYLDYTLSLIRARQAEEDARDQRMAEQARQLAANLNADDVRAYAASLGSPAADPETGEVPPPPPSGLRAPDPVGPERSLQWPPGFAGALAGFIYRSAPRPVKEVAIVAALGWLAGVCGKSWNIPGSGLNIYLILVARSAIGKEAMHSGLGNLLAKLRESIPSAQEFVDFTDFASGPALVKACATNQCFVNVAGEWGRKLKRLAQDGDRDGPMQQLRTVMTNLYQKSGPASVVGGLSYSDKEKNVASVSGVAYSMIGETTPGTFYESLTESMMEDGFLSRFTIVEYAGERPPANYHPQIVPEPPLVDRCIELVMQSKTMMTNRAQPIMVQRDMESADIMNAFDKECDEQINSTQDEAWRQMWNRAQLKMMRIAALLACGDNPQQPCITGDHTRWALELIRRDIAIMKRRIEAGDVGVGDATRERKLIMLMREYLANELSPSYKIPKEMQKAGIVPRAYLQIRTSRLSTFNTSRAGATRALDDALRSCCDSGYIMEVDKAKLMDTFGTTGRAYRILSLPDYSAIS